MVNANVKIEISRNRYCALRFFQLSGKLQGKSKRYPIQIAPTRQNLLPETAPDVNDFW